MKNAISSTTIHVNTKRTHNNSSCVARQYRVRRSRAMLCSGPVESAILKTGAWVYNTVMFTECSASALSTALTRNALHMQRESMGTYYLQTSLRCSASAPIAALTRNASLYLCKSVDLDLQLLLKSIASALSTALTRNASALNI